MKSKENTHLISYIYDNGSKYATDKITNNLSEKEFITDFMSEKRGRIILFYKVLED